MESKSRGGGKNYWFMDQYKWLAYRNIKKKNDSTWNVANSDERRPCIGFRITVVFKRKK